MLGRKEGVSSGLEPELMCNWEVATMLANGHVQAIMMKVKKKGTGKINS